MVYVYKCVISGAEMVDDGLEIEEDYEGHVLKVLSKKIEDENSEDGEKVNNFVTFFNYELTKMDKKAFLTFIKNYVKKVLTHVEEKHPTEAEAFKKQSMAFV